MTTHEKFGDVTLRNIVRILKVLKRIARKISGSEDAMWIGKKFVEKLFGLLLGGWVDHDSEKTDNRQIWRVNCPVELREVNRFKGNTSGRVGGTRAGGCSESLNNEIDHNPTCEQAPMRPVLEAR